MPLLPCPFHPRPALQDVPARAVIRSPPSVISKTIKRLASVGNGGFRRCPLMCRDDGPSGGVAIRFLIALERRNQIALHDLRNGEINIAAEVGHWTCS